MKLTQATAVAIATAASQIRPDWDHPGILAALRVEAERGTPAPEVFVALANLARNPHARTPSLLNKRGSWWVTPDGPVERRGDHNQPCPSHPDQDEPCPHPDHAGDMTLDDVREMASKLRVCQKCWRVHPDRSCSTEGDDA